ncbi:MAG: serine hydrolase domain-containing protein [Candidatus Bipolaricaulia bacterium]
MAVERLQAGDTVIQSALAKDIFPGAVVLVARKGKVIKHSSYGLALKVPEPREMTKTTIFDLASLTKVVVTVPLALMLVEHGIWHLHDPIKKFLPQFNVPGVTLWHLLTHTSGLPAWANLFYKGAGREGVFQELVSYRWPIITPICRPGERVIYSDLGYILLGLAIEEATGKPLEVLAKDWIFAPLGMQDTFFNPPQAVKSRIAATEDDPSRGGVLVGVVHDENAWAMGGVSGHAGLFSTAWDLAVFAQMILNKGSYAGKRILSPASIRLMTSPQTEGLNERRGLGWLLQGNDTLPAGDLLSEKAFGHTGFTGTSLWLDPLYELIVVFLTNRVHPKQRSAQEEMQRLRALVHNSVVGAIVSE